MSEIVSLEEYRRRRDAEHMIVLCGGGPRVQIQWMPVLDDKDKERIRRAVEDFNVKLREIADASKI